MESKREHELDTILQHSNLDVIDTISSLIKVIEQLLNAGFKNEQIGTYNSHLTILKDFISYSNNHDENVKTGECVGSEKSVDKEGSKVADVKLETFHRVCQPLLSNLFPSQDSSPDILILLGNTAKLTAACVMKNEKMLIEVVELITSNINTYIFEGPSSYILQDRSTPDVATQLEVLRHVLSVTTSFECLESSLLQKLSVLFEQCIKTVKNISNEILGTWCIPVLLKILNINSGDYDHLLNIVWDCAKQCQEDAERKEYLLLCGFANHFLPVNGQLRNDSTVDVRKDRQLWSMLQAGLYSKDSLTRKRSLYIIKRIVDICESNHVELNGDDNLVFWWTNEKQSTLSKVWEDFMLLAEVFEEKQVHVIKPLLPRMKNLVKASCLNGENEKPLLHTSWLKTVLLRCSHHESLQIIRWSAETVLSLDLTQCPMIQQGLDQYLAGEMLYSLQEPKLYVKEPSVPSGTLPVIADKLVQYFMTCWTSLPADKKGPFFCLTLQNIAARNWGPIPLLFICRGLSMVPQSPCLDRDTVLCMRKLLSGFLFTMDTYFRSSIQGYIVQILIKLTDKRKVSLEDFMQILCLVRQEESLQRGTTLWSQCVTWFSEECSDLSGWNSDGMRQHLEAIVSTYLATTIDSRYSVADGTTAGNIARLLLLASDASIATVKDDSGRTTLMKITDQLIGVLNSINTHAYMSTHKADKAILLLSSLVTEAGPKDCVQDDDVKNVIYTAVENCQSELTVYICRQMVETIVSLEDLGVLYLYMDGVQMITKCIGVKCCPYLIPLVDRCVDVLTQQTQDQSMRQKLHQLSSMCILGKVSGYLVNQDDARFSEFRNKVCSLSKSWTVVSNFSKPVGVQSLSHQEWGKMTSLFLEHEWQVILLALQDGTTHWYDMLELLTVAEDTLSVGLEQTTVIVLRCLRLIIPQVKDVLSEDRMVAILTTCWSCLQEARRLIAFWDVLESFLQATFQSCLLQMDEQSLVVQKLIEFADEMIEFGTDKNGVVNALSTQLYKVLSTPDMIGHTRKYITLIVNLCRFGSLVRRGVRQVYDICAALEQDEKGCPAKGLINGVQNEDIGVRVAVVSLLCSLNPEDPSHCCIATSIIQSCCQVYRDVAKATTIRYSNSLVHRQRHRLIQTVLLLQGFVTDDSVRELWDTVWCNLEFETQPSVRHMLEWLILWMMYKHQHFRPQLWLLFEKYRDSKNLTLCSLLCIVIHLGPHLPKHEQVEYFKTAMPYILPWCMAHHFQTRIYSQAVLAKLWDQCRLLGLEEILNENAILQCIMDFTEQNKNSTKNVKKLLDSFVFKYLDFERDFTLETLFQIMPRMTALTEEDWISPDAFLDLNPAWSDNTTCRVIRLRNISRDMEECDPGLWKYIGLKVPGDDEAADDTVVVDDSEGDVQKKIMPWRQMMLEDDAVADVDHGVKQLTEDGLVVVTSLINKVPNLGGLCRTSEIFGVSEYVMGKLGCVEDKAFQGLSVTAHKWIPITEVPESKLEDYLQQKRLEGYKLVGVEQTANSVSLTDYTFPEKTLLLLGNEKEGIPVELISHLDVCVEIPQQGVVRSLNVHVSGAILIWEYRRQQLMKTLNS